MKSPTLLNEPQGKLRKRKRYKNGWTPAENALIRKLVKKGFTTEKMAPYFPNRTLWALKHQRFSLKIKREPPWFSPQNKQCVAELVKFKMAGYSHKQIAARYAVSIQKISWVLCKAGFPQFRRVVKMPAKKKKRWSDVEIELLRKDLKRGIRGGQLHERHSQRTPRAVDKKVYQITRFWPTPQETARRETLARHNAAKALKVDWDTPSHWQ
ncbi:MAG: hypothetical protein OXI63_02035 [Candidatus Poribacteria bacterium]|nr:hypothetical protein [Candidatus Poribacteria bacterium]